MAVLDARLFPLLETLASAGLDWLAFEIVDGVRRGREPLETEEMLQAVREQVRSRQYSDRMSADLPVMAKPIRGDDQIVWAGNHVFSRLDGILEDLDKGCAMIEAVAQARGEIYGQDHPALFKATAGVPLKILMINPEGHPVDHGAILAAKNELIFLKAALDRWVREAQGRAIDDPAS